VILVSGVEHVAIALRTKQGVVSIAIRGHGGCEPGLVVLEHHGSAGDGLISSAEAPIVIHVPEHVTGQPRAREGDVPVRGEALQPHGLGIGDLVVHPVELRADERAALEIPHGEHHADVAERQVDLVGTVG